MNVLVGSTVATADMWVGLCANIFTVEKPGVINQSIKALFSREIWLVGTVKWLIGIILYVNTLYFEQTDTAEVEKVCNLPQCQAKTITVIDWLIYLSKQFTIRTRTIRKESLQNDWDGGERKRKKNFKR